MAYQLYFVNFTNVQRDSNVPAYMEILNLIFRTWLMFAIIFCMLPLGVKKIGGFWSVDQGFTDDESPRAHNEVPLDTRNSSPPAYSPPQTALPGDESSGGGAQMSGAARQDNGHQPQPWQQQPEASDAWLAAHLRPGNVRSQATTGPAYNAADYDMAILPHEPGPHDAGYMADIPAHEPPSHDEIMGLNHQADGFAPRTEPLPYPDKK